MARFKVGDKIEIKVLPFLYDYNGNKGEVIKGTFGEIYTDPNHHLVNVKWDNGKEEGVFKKHLQKITLSESKSEYVWIRMGDVAEYEKFDSPHSAGEYVGEAIHYERTEPHSYFFSTAGVEIMPYFVGRNYVSLYWGNEEAQWIRALTHKEQMKFIDGIEHQEVHLK